VFAAGAHIDWDALGALAGIISLAGAGGLAVRSWLAERAKERQREQEEIDFKGDRLKRVEHLLGGTPADPILGTPAVPGLAQNFDKFQKFVTHELSTNGGGSLKDEVVLLKKVMGGLVDDVSNLKSAER
jgi:hypothetical protein